MWPDEPYAPDRGSFRRPVVPPIGDPDASPGLTVTVACEWLPFIRGALQQLLLQATWDTASSSTLLLTQKRAFNLISMFQECGSPVLISCPFDFTVPGGGDDGWANISEPTYAPNQFGAFFDTLGWVSTQAVKISGDLHIRTIEIYKTFTPAISVDRLEVQFDVSYGNRSAGSAAQGLVAYHGGVVQTTALYNPDTDTDGHKTVEVSGGPWTIDRVELYLACGYQHGADPAGITELEFWGYNKVGGGCA